MMENAPYLHLRSGGVRLLEGCGWLYRGLLTDLDAALSDGRALILPVLEPLRAASLSARL